ncbi:hypothetical protein [Nostoc sp.]|uniref:hypothetical protein n=1 Tax=Nostoc sp. TaxID=1180 RepID=UPI002FFD2A96
MGGFASRLAAEPPGAAFPAYDWKRGFSRFSSVSLLLTTCFFVRGAFRREGVQVSQETRYYPISL